MQMKMTLEITETGPGDQVAMNVCGIGGRHTLQGVLPIEAARGIVKCVAWHDTLVNNLQVCRDLLRDLTVTLGHEKDGRELLERLDKCLKEAK